MATRCFLVCAGLLFLGALPAAVAWRSGPPPSDQQIVTLAHWIFAGRVTRTQVFPRDIVGAPPAVFVTVNPGLILRGDPPKTVRMCLRMQETPVAGGLYIFYAVSDANPAGFNAHLVGFRPYSTVMLNKTKALLPLHPYTPTRLK